MHRLHAPLLPWLLLLLLLGGLPLVRLGGSIVSLRGRPAAMHHQSASLTLLPGDAIACQHALEAPCLRRGLLLLAGGMLRHGCRRRRRLLLAHGL